MSDKSLKQIENSYLVNRVALKMIRAARAADELGRQFKFPFTKEDEKRGSRVCADHFTKAAEEIVSFLREHIV